MVPENKAMRVPRSGFSDLGNHNLQLVFRIRSYNPSSASQAVRTPSSCFNCFATLAARCANFGSVSIAFSLRATRQGM
jgi:hypothetical protein